MAALSVIAFASCDLLSEKKDPNEKILDSYYEPLIGKWNVVKWYGTEVNESGVEEAFDLSDGLEKGLYTYTFTFKNDNVMISELEFDDTENTDSYKVSFRIDVPNFFKADHLNQNKYLNYEIIKINDSILHLKEYANDATSNYECVRIE